MADITINAEDGGRFTAYVANKQNVSGHGLLLIQEIFGVNPTMRDLADDLSLNGYVVVCPDLFWRLKPNVSLNPDDEGERRKAFGYLERFDVDQGVEDLKATLTHMRRMERITGKVGVVGYCLGGRMAYLMMTRSNADAGVSYYPIGLEKLLDTAFAITKPYMAHIAGQDTYVPKASQDAIREAFARNPNINLNLFEAQQHAFARVGAENWDARAAGVANQLTAEFFRQYLA